MSLFTETVEIGVPTKTGEDNYGNDIVDTVWSESSAWLEQTNSTENDVQQEQTTATMRVFLPLGTAVEHTHKVRWDGHVWDVKGEPGRQPGGFVVKGFQMILISRTEG